MILDLAGQLAQWSELPEGLMCTYFSPAHKAVAAQLRDWMQAAGLDAAIDAVGNVVGRYASARRGRTKTLIVGSHYDTVANAGQFDGRLGILTALGGRGASASHRPAIAVSSRRDRLLRRGRRAILTRPISAAAPLPAASTRVCWSGATQNDVSLGTVLRKRRRRPCRHPGAWRGHRRPFAAISKFISSRVRFCWSSGLPVGVVTSIAGSARFRDYCRGRCRACGDRPDAASARCGGRGGGNRACGRAAVRGGC